MLVGSVIGVLIRLCWPASMFDFKLLIVGLGSLGAVFMYVTAQAIKSAYPSMQRNDWTLAYVLRDAAKQGVLPKSERLVSVAKAFGIGFALVFGCLIGLSAIEMLRTAS
jgi:hypothetical protein